jgi:hypothetical protein
MRLDDKVLAWRLPVVGAFGAHVVRRLPEAQQFVVSHLDEPSPKLFYVDGFLVDWRPTNHGRMRGNMRTADQKWSRQCESRVSLDCSAPCLRPKRS